MFIKIYKNVNFSLHTKKNILRMKYCTYKELIILLRSELEGINVSFFAEKHNLSRVMISTLMNIDPDKEVKHPQFLLSVLEKLGHTIDKEPYYLIKRDTYETRKK